MNLKTLNTQEVTSLFKDKRIAVIGSSPNLIGRSLGKTIDEYDLVLRFNDAVLFTKEYEIDYGSKCDIWCISGWSPYLDKEYPNKYFLSDFPKGYDNKGGSDPFLSFIRDNNPTILGTRTINQKDPSLLQKGLTMRGPIFELIKHFELPYINTPSEIFHLDMLGGYNNLSSGLAAILLTIHFQPLSVDLFGFGFFDYNKPTHYWNQVHSFTKEMKQNGIGHNGDKEKTIIKHLVESFNLGII